MQEKTVLIYRNELLPVSETFIKEQILALKDWRARARWTKATGSVAAGRLEGSDYRTREFGRSPIGCRGKHTGCLAISPEAGAGDRAPLSYSCSFWSRRA
jgi:hypothetical protein